MYSTESQVKSQYDRLAKIYDHRWRVYVSNTLNHLIFYLQKAEQLHGNERVLDLACGTGELERLLLNNYPNLEIVGVDLSDEMLELAKQKLPDLEFIKADAIALPFAEQSFDTVIIASAFHYFESPSIALTEIRRILKPQGKLIIMDWCRDYLLCQLLDLFLKVFDPAHKFCYTQVELHDLLIKVGFEVRAQQKQKLGVFWGVMIAAANS
jgi:ubiquinone/menaquinone biosynthesis C-methylase UbiE